MSQTNGIKSKYLKNFNPGQTPICYYLQKLIRDYD